MRMVYIFGCFFCLAKDVNNQEKGADLSFLRASSRSGVCPDIRETDVVLEEIS